MAKKQRAQPKNQADLSRIMANLHSMDEIARLKAVQSVCPCRMGWGPFQQCMEDVQRMQKDPSPAIRRAALHVFEDAFEMDGSSLPTSRQETTNEMVARKRRVRWQPENDEEGMTELQDREASERQRDQARARKQSRRTDFGRR